MLEKVGAEDREAIGGYVTIREGDEDGRPKSSWSVIFFSKETPPTDYPLETHVFASLSAKLPVYVATARGDWVVEGTKISFLGPGAVRVPGGISRRRG